MKGIITFVNEATCRYFDTSKDEFIGRTFWHLVPAEDICAIMGHIESITPEEPVGMIERRVVTAAGKIRWVQWVHRAILGADGQIVEYQGVGRDVTDLRLAGQALRDSERKLRLLSSRLLLAHEEERKRIAIELHDNIGSFLVAAKIGVETVRNQITSGEVTPDLLDAPVTWIQQTLSEIRRMMSELRPSVLDDLGLITAIGWYCRRYHEVNPYICIEKKIEMEERDIPENLKIVIFRIIQEALSNIVKYSNADFLTICLAKENEAIRLTIEDTGMGFDVEKARSGGDHENKLGLSSMQERAKLSGGSLVIESEVGLGTTVRATWPCG